MNKSVSNALQSNLVSREQWLKTRSGEQCLIRVAAEDTGGLYSLVEIVSSPGDATPLHVHEKEDEHMFVVEGTASVAYGDKVLEAKPGELMTLRRGIPHAWGNRSSADLRIVMLASPGGCEEALRVIAEDREVDLRALAERFRITVLGPAPF